MRTSALIGLAELPAEQHAKAMASIVHRLRDPDPIVKRVALESLCHKSRRKGELNRPDEPEFDRQMRREEEAEPPMLVPPPGQEW